jgi:hypothetical protein
MVAILFHTSPTYQRKSGAGRDDIPSTINIPPSTGLEPCSNKLAIAELNESYMHPGSDIEVRLLDLIQEV